MEDPELVAPVMATDYGARVLSDGRRAPKLIVRFECPMCRGESELDAFLGVPLCPLDNTILKGIAVIHPLRPNKSQESAGQVDTTGIGKPYEGSPSDHELWTQAREGQ